VAQLDAVVSSFAAFAAQVLLDAGIPRSRVMVHTGTFFGRAPRCSSNCSFNSPQAALVQSANPAWSLYGAETSAASNAGLPTALGALGGGAWGACEWLPFFDAGHAESEWSDAIEGTLGFLNNRLIVVQNFESIEKDANATAAVAAALGGQSCIVDAPTALAASVVKSSTVAISWTAPPPMGVGSQLLLVSTLGLTLPNANLAVPDVATAQLGPGATHYDLHLPAGMGASEIYVQVVTVSMQGCGGPGQSFTQSVPSDALVVPLV
jgi:hypothetical protein